MDEPAIEPTCPADTQSQNEFWYIVSGQFTEIGNDHAIGNTANLPFPRLYCFSIAACNTSGGYITTIHNVHGVILLLLKQVLYVYTAQTSRGAHIHFTTIASLAPASHAAPTLSNYMVAC